MVLLSPHHVGRIGIMGYNSLAETVQKVLQALEDGLQHCRAKLGSSL